MQCVEDAVPTESVKEVNHFKEAVLPPASAMFTEPSSKMESRLEVLVRAVDDAMVHGVPTASVQRLRASVKAMRSVET